MGYECICRGLAKIIMSIFLDLNAARSLGAQKQCEDNEQSMQPLLDTAHLCAICFLVLARTVTAHKSNSCNHCFCLHAIKRLSKIALKDATLMLSQPLFLKHLILGLHSIMVILLVSHKHKHNWNGAPILHLNG